MRRISCTVIAVAALLGGSVWANAQDVQDQGKQQKAQQAPQKAQPAPQRTQQAPQRREAPQVRSQTPGPSKSVARERPQKSEGARTRSVERKAPDRSVRSRNEIKKSTETKKAVAPRETRKSVASKKAVESKKSLESKKAAESKSRLEKGRETKAREDAKRTGEASKAADTKAGARLQVTEQHRARLRETLSKQRVARTNVRFAVSVGGHVPRHVRLHAFPATYIAFAPEYRRYRYVIVEDRICIVDPATYEIVAVLDEGPGFGPRQHVAGLELTAEERAFILANVPRDQARARIRINLALGAEVPRRVSLARFPSEILRVVPKVRTYRYVIVDEDVVIVDPRARSVAVVIRG